MEAMSKQNHHSPGKKSGKKISPVVAALMMDS